MAKAKPRRVRQVSKKWQAKLRFLPCFFDVPVKYVHVILNISHHTLDPMRRAFNLDRWPYGEVAKGKFYMTLEEIADLRSSMMSSADESMQLILRRMAECAEECKARNEPPSPSQEPDPLPGDQEPDFHEDEGGTDSREFWDDISRIFEMREAAQEPCRSLS